MRRINRFLTILALIVLTQNCVYMSTTRKDLHFHARKDDTKQLVNDDSSNYDSIASDIDKLRNKGMELIERKKYVSAMKYYSALLQLLAGYGGEEIGFLRQRCALTLAECEIKSGKFYHAIITCTEIIEEAPDHTDLIGESTMNTTVSEKAIVLGKAHYKRAQSLEKVQKSSLALSDYDIATQLLPNDRKVQYRRKNLLLAIEGTIGSAKRVTSSEVYDFIESIGDIAKRNKLSKSEITRMSSDEKKETISQDASMTGPSSLLSGGLGLGLGLGSPFGGIKSKSSLLDMLTFGLNMLGMSEKSTKNILEMADAIIKTCSTYHFIFKSLVSNKSIIISLFTAIWILSALNDWSKAKRIAKLQF